MHMGKFIGAIAGAALLAFAAASGAGAAEEAALPHYPLKHPKHVKWSFAGPFGHWNIAQLQRGLKIYKDVCAACHSMHLVAFRDLAELGYSEDQIKAFAAEYQIHDGPNDSGDMFDRPGRPSDHFPSPFANTEAAAAANNGAPPPDFSLLAKARGIERGFPTFVFDVFTQYAEGGPDYIYSLLTGYEDPPAGFEVPEGGHYNPYFANAAVLAMPPPLSDGLVEFSDDAPQTVDQYARDVAAFLMWASEPKLVERKALGFRVMAFLLLFAALMYLTKKKVWAGLKEQSA
jgi:ubiquinol-cytochrome c reductase cytochrome c1 subunit